MSGEQLAVVRLAEAAGEVTNYAPVFVAEDQGFFEEEGLRLESTVVGGPRVISEISSGNVDVAACGAWRTAAYRFHVDPELRIFAPLTTRCPIVLISREPVEEFQWTDLYDKTVVLGPVAPPPWLMLNMAMQAAGADVSRVKAIRDLQPNESGPLYQGGMGDYFFAMPPFSQVLVDQGHHEAASFADVGGVPWSMYFSRRAFLASDDRAVRFAKALSRGVDWLFDHDPSEAPAMLDARFPGVGRDAASAAIRTARDHQVWSRGVRVDEEALMRWQHAMTDYGVLPHPIPYHDLVDDSVAARVERG